MSVFEPDKSFKRLSDVPFELLQEWRIKAILLDTDNTIASRDREDFLPDALEWVEKAKDKKYKIAIVSNGLPWRIKKACEILGIPYLVPAPILKPFPFGFRLAARKLGVTASECVMIGDQRFTDIQGANRAGMRTIQVEPVNPKTDLPWTKLLRKITKG